MLLCEAVFCCYCKSNFLFTGFELKHEDYLFFRYTDFLHIFSDLIL